jgi:hypothetical protein
MNIIVIDISGTHVKVLVTGQKVQRQFDSGQDLTPQQMVSKVQQLVTDWKYDVISIGFCMIIGGEKEAVQLLAPIFATLAPGAGSIPRISRRDELDGTAEEGCQPCGPNGVGHFFKMVHNGIDYGIMAAYPEGLGVLCGANIGKKQDETRTNCCRRCASVSVDTWRKKETK